VLDVGCGAGEITSEIGPAPASTSSGSTVAEKEPLPGELRRARDPQLDGAPRPRPRGEWAAGGRELRCRMWRAKTLEHVLDTAAWLSQVRRVLRSDGTLVLSTAPRNDRLALLALALSARRFERALRPALGPRPLLHAPHARTACLPTSGSSRSTCAAPAARPARARTLLAFCPCASRF